MITVKATREGLVGHRTASGYVIESHVPFVALPSTQALRQWVRLFNPLNGKGCRALVLDVGPWNTEDHAYVFQPDTLLKRGVGFPNPTLPPINTKDGIRPQAESGMSLSMIGTNKAGIDLGEAVWTALGMDDNGLVCWEFD